MKPRKPKQSNNYELNIDTMNDETKKYTIISKPDDNDDDAAQTEKLSVSQLEHLQLDRKKLQYQSNAGSFILLYIPNALEPIELSNVTRVTLGRSNPYSEIDPTIDLNPYQAKLLGVSRLHAEIVYRDNIYYVNDLESTNGTWVNHKLVTPDEPVVLHDSDTLRMGNFVIQIGLA